MSRRPSKRNRKRDYSLMDEQEVRRVVKDYSDMIKRISYQAFLPTIRDIPKSMRRTVDDVLDALSL